MSDEEVPTGRRFGIVTADPLRFVGLQTVLSVEPGVTMIPLTGATDGSLKSLTMVVIDATSTALLFELIAAFREEQPALPLLVLGTEADHSFVERVIGAGAKGYVTHGATEKEVCMAVQIVLEGSVWAPRKVLARLLERGFGEQQRAKRKPLLTPREREVLQRLMTGSSNKEIGAGLQIDASAVKAHVGRLMRKVGVTNRTALSVETTRRRLLEPDEGGDEAVGEGL